MMKSVNRITENTKEILEMTLECGFWNASTEVTSPKFRT